jgi:hypothetical protein
MVFISQVFRSHIRAFVTAGHSYELGMEGC